MRTAILLLPTLIRLGKPMSAAQQNGANKEKVLVSFDLSLPLEPQLQNARADFVLAQRQLGLAGLFCIDCRTDVAAIGQFYMLHDDIWVSRLKLNWHDNLCVGCLEARLGRKVRLADFDMGWPCNHRVVERLGLT
jgi:hypothetical protein